MCTCCRSAVLNQAVSRSVIQVGCWITSWHLSCTGRAVWPTSPALVECPTSSITSSHVLQTEFMKELPSEVTGVCSSQRLFNATYGLMHCKLLACEFKPAGYVLPAGIQALCSWITCWGIRTHPESKWSLCSERWVSRLWHLQSL